jgi:hypothetical protein
MTVTIGEHSQTSITEYGDYVLLWTSKSFSVAVDAVGRITTGYAFTAKFMKEQSIVRRLSDAVLSTRLIQEMARIARGTLPYKDLPSEVYTDMGFLIDATFLEWSTEANLYLLYVISEGIRCPVKTYGRRCEVHGRGMIDTSLLFCIPFYCCSRGCDVVSVDLPDGYLYTMCALLNGKVFNHNYLSQTPSVFFSYIIQEQEACEITGNKALIAELKRKKLLSYVK